MRDKKIDLLTSPSTVWPADVDREGEEPKLSIGAILLVCQRMTSTEAEDSKILQISNEGIGHRNINR
jgi:hypothetical protein